LEPSVKVRRDAGREAFQQQRVRFDGIEECLEFLHSTLALLVVAPRQRKRCGQHGDGKQAEARSHLSFRGQVRLMKVGRQDSKTAGAHAARRAAVRERATGSENGSTVTTQCNAPFVLQGRQRETAARDCTRLMVESRRPATAGP
jgi:hypothetical protein